MTSQTRIAFHANTLANAAAYRAHHTRLPQGKAAKSRLGLSLADAAGIFGGGKKGGAAQAPAASFEPLIGTHDEASTNSDVGGTKDLVARR